MIRSVLLLVLALLIPPAARAADEPPPKPLAVTHITVIDTSGGPSMADMTVVVSGDRITAVGKSEQMAVPKDATVIDGAGKFLIPGLWDMHTHGGGRSYRHLQHPAYLANGVTGVRGMWGAPGQLLVRKEIQDGKALGPRIVLAGDLVDGPGSVWKDRGALIVTTEDEGRTAVRKTKADGYDFVKVYSRLDRDTYLAIADEAKKLRIPFDGHVPIAVGPNEASSAGQRCFEHVYEIDLGCSSDEVELRNDKLRAFKDPAKRDRELFRRTQERVWDTYDAKKAEALFKRFVSNVTWQCPTLTVLHAIGRLDDPVFLKDERLKYIAVARRDSWLPANDPRLKDWKPEDYAHSRKGFQKTLDYVGRMHKAGVPILAGTDTENPYCFPGFSLHDELELLTKAGLTPLEGLKTATLNPAKFLDREKDIGTVEQGKLADLVLLDADPLKDIKNTKKIAGVIVGGKLLSKESLEKMMADVEAGAGKK